MLSVKIKNTIFKNPILTASGTFGYGDEISEFVDIKKLGGIVTKSVTLQPREGNPQPRIAETDSGMLNSIGLANVGVNEYCKTKLGYLNELDTNFRLSTEQFQWLISVIVHFCGQMEEEAKKPENQPPTDKKKAEDICELLDSILVQHKQTGMGDWNLFWDKFTYMLYIQNENHYLITIVNIQLYLSYQVNQL